MRAEACRVRPERPDRRRAHAPMDSRLAAGNWSRARASASPDAGPAGRTGRGRRTDVAQWLGARRYRAPLPPRWARAGHDRRLDRAAEGADSRPDTPRPDRPAAAVPGNIVLRPHQPW